MNAKRSLTASKLILIVLLATWLFVPDPYGQYVTAQEPDGEPDFEAQSFVSTSGESTIVLQRAVLTSDYFGQTGVLEDMTVGSEGLTLTTEATEGGYRSGTIESPLDYTTDIALSWLADLSEGASVSVEIRLSNDGETWGTWLPVPVEYYPTRDGEYSGALIWVDTASVFCQFRLSLQAGESGVSPVFHHLTLLFNDTSNGPTDRTAASRAQAGAIEAASELCPKPPVISRVAWGCPDGSSSPRWPPTYQSVTHVVINHTATPNSASDWARVVRSIWNYHANSWGWGDIGYHYLIDPLGNIYEGRAGGDDVVGAYDGFNQGSMGIGYIGCYGNCEYLSLTNADPSAAMLAAGNDLMAWKFSQKDIDPRGSGTYCETTLPHIVPRSSVTCRGGSLSPGDRLRAEIPSMREDVWDKMQACSGSATIYGTVWLQGRSVYDGIDVVLSESSCPVEDDSGTLRTTTNDQGHFSVVSTVDYQCLKAERACYLTGQKSQPQGYVGRIKLLGGDVDGDDCITILDLTLVGSRNGTTNPTPACADINGDGEVNIYDLVIVASNFGKCGPISDWQ